MSGLLKFLIHAQVAVDTPVPYHWYVLDGA